MSKKLKRTNAICLGGILTAITVVFQTAPVFLPAVGLALSPLSSLPVLLAAALEIPMGIAVLFSSVFIIFAVSPQEAVILLLTTGPLGLSIGSLLFRKGRIITLFLSAISLFTGIALLTYVVGIPAFGDFSKEFSFTMFLSFLLFSFVYACFWTFCAGKFIGKLRKLRLLQPFLDK